MTAHTLTPRDAKVLAALTGDGGPLTTGELAGRTRMPTHAVLFACRALESRGLVRRVRRGTWEAVS